MRKETSMDKKNSKSGKSLFSKKNKEEIKRNETTKTVEPKVEKPKKEKKVKQVVKKEKKEHTKFSLPKRKNIKASSTASSETTATEEIVKPKKIVEKKKAVHSKKVSTKNLPKPVIWFFDKCKWLGKQIMKLIRIIPTLIPKKAEKDAPLLDGNVKILPQFCIQTKLIGCYIIPVIMIIVLGIVSYTKSSGALNENYEAAVSQTMNMAKEYFDFVFTNIESDMNVYLSDEELSAYFSGEYSTNESQEKAKAEYKKKYDDTTAKLEATKEGSLAYYKAYKENVDARIDYDDATQVITTAEDAEKAAYESMNKSVSNKIASNQFIGNIYILKDGYDIISSQMSLRAEAKSDTQVDEKKKNADAGKIYSAFLGTKFGGEVTGDTTKYHWSGPITELDKLLYADSKDYILRVAHDVTSTSDAVMIVDIKRASIMSILQNLNLGEGSFVGIITPDKQELVVEGKALSSNTDSSEDKKDQNTVVKDKVYSDQDFYQDALKSEETSGSDYVRYDGSSYLFTYQKIGESGIMLCSLVPESIIVAQANSIRIVTLFMVFFSCLIAMVVGTLISKGFSKSINLSIRELEKVSKGDLTVEFRTNRRDEFALLYGSCNDMLANIRGLIQEVESVYEALSISLNHVNSSSTTFSETTKEIQQSVHEIETGVGEQTENATECLTQMDSLFNKINVVNDDTNEIGSIANATQIAITTGISTMDNLNDKTKSTTNITDSVIQTIQQLAVHSTNIGQIVNSINDIAEETNLLSLNASIEAARAGAAGKGFSVVATQIRKLADQCLASAGKISGLVNEIKNATEDAVSTAHTAEEIVDDQVKAVAATASSFQDLKTKIEKLSDYLESIQNSSKDMEASGSTTLSSMENISAILEETLASVTSVATVTDKQSEALTSLDEASSQLMVRSERLGDAISKFKTK